MRSTCTARHRGAPRPYEKADVELRPWPERHSCASLILVAISGEPPAIVSIATVSTAIVGIAIVSSGDQRRAGHRLCHIRLQALSHTVAGSITYGCMRTAVRMVEEHHCSVRLLQLILRRALSGKGEGEG